MRSSQLRKASEKRQREFFQETYGRPPSTSELLQLLENYSSDKIGESIAKKKLSAAEKEKKRKDWNNFNNGYLSTDTSHNEE